MKQSLNLYSKASGRKANTSPVITLTGAFAAGGKIFLTKAEAEAYAKKLVVI